LKIENMDAILWVVPEGKNRFHSLRESVFGVPVRHHLVFKTVFNQQSFIPYQGIVLNPPSGVTPLRRGRGSGARSQGSKKTPIPIIEATRHPATSNEQRATGIQHPVSNRGFTLIEILVSISVLSIAMVVIMQLFSGGLKSSRLSDAYARGIFHAREKMEEILLGTEIAAEVSEGEFDDAYRWRSEIVREEQPEEDASKLPFDAYHIRVDIFWDEGNKEKNFGITTMKLVEKKRDGEPGGN